MYILILSTYVVNSVDEGIVARVAHGQPVETKEEHVYVSVAAKEKYSR